MLKTPAPVDPGACYPAPAPAPALAVAPGSAAQNPAPAHSSPRTHRRQERHHGRCRATTHAHRRRLPCLPSPALSFKHAAGRTGGDPPQRQRAENARGCHRRRCRQGGTGKPFLKKVERSPAACWASACDRPDVLSPVCPEEHAIFTLKYQTPRAFARTFFATSFLMFQVGPIRS